MHYCIHLSLGIRCARYGAREGRARSEMGEVLPGFCRRTYMPVVNRFSQAATYTRTWGTWRYAFLFKEDQVDQSLSTQARTRVCRPKRLESKCAPAKTRASLLTAASHINIIEARALENLHCQQRIRGLEEHAMPSADQFGAVAISLERTTRHLTGVFGMRVRSSRCPAVRAICQVSIPHVRAR